MMLEWVAANPAPRGTLFDVADHIDHIREVAGVDHVGVGSDFYDAGGPSMAQGLEDVTRFPNLFVELLRRGYTDEEVKKIAGLNLLRAMREMERVSEELRRSMLPLLDDLKPIGAR
jgi:membrane dipeptidase